MGEGCNADRECFKGENTDGEPIEKWLGRTLLKNVSRSFYLTLRVLPSAFRAPASIGYLLARASDTLADTSGESVEHRLHLLEQFQLLMKGGTAPETACSWLRLVNLSQVDDSWERMLLSQVPAILEGKKKCPEWQQEAIEEVLHHIIEGQIWDLKTFGVKEELVRVESLKELDTYTYQVAGCVGEFWTQLGLGLSAHSREGFSLYPEKELLSLARNYGKGLQLVNILRDVEEDKSLGRSYLPQTNPYGYYLELATQYLNEGVCYAHSLSSYRLRYASLLPARLGLRTLSLLRTFASERQVKKLKVSRKVVYCELVLSAFYSCFKKAGRASQLKKRSETF